MISVIIPTFNRAKLLSLALNSLNEQTLNFNQFEVLVVDNGSRDETPEIAKSHRATWNMRYFVEPTPGLHAGRHRGLKESRGDVLVFCDDDIQAIPTWLEAIADCFRNPSVAMVGGNNYPIFETSPPSWLLELWQSPFAGGHGIPSLSILELPTGRREVSPLQVWGCNFSIRKEVLLDAGGFHPDSMPEKMIRFRGDGETHVSKFVIQKGYKCIFDSNASVHHFVPEKRMTTDYFRNRGFNQGVSDSFTMLRRTRRQYHWCILNAYCFTKRTLQLVRNHVVNATRRASPDMTKVQRAYIDGYWEGFRFHQRAYRIDQEVSEWVHKSNFLGEASNGRVDQTQ